MRVLTKFIVTLVITLGIITGSLFLLGQDDIAIYFVANSVAYLIISLLFVNLASKTRVFADALSVMIFFGFFTILAFKVLDTLR